MAATISEVVRTPGVPRPVHVSALVTDGVSATTITSDVSDFIDDSTKCTNVGNTGYYVCNFKSGFWASTPMCLVNPLGAGAYEIYNAQAYIISTSSVAVRIRAEDGDLTQNVDSDFQLFCDGVKN
jgi:hypothetical protein